MALMMLSFEAKIINGGHIRADRLYKNQPIIINGVVGELFDAEFVNDPDSRGQQVRVKFIFHTKQGHYIQEHTVDREFTFQTLDIIPIKENLVTEEPAADDKEKAKG
jgi:hypothetical protein